MSPTSGVATIAGGKTSPEGVRRAPYIATALVLLLFVVVSVWVPAAHVHFPADLPPLFLNWYPLVGPELVVPLALAVAFVASIPRLIRLPVPLLLVCLVAFIPVFAASLAMEAGQIRTFRGCCLPGSGTALLTAQFERRGEYYAAVPLVRELGPKAFAQRFPELDRVGSGALPLHVTTHPPGAPILLWALDELVGRSVLRVSVLVVLIGGIAVIPTYAVAREVHGEAVARTAAVMYAAAPGVAIYSATSMDVVFMAVVAAAAAALVRAPRSVAWAVMGGVLAALANLITWAALALGPVGLGWGAVVIWRGERARGVARRGAAAVAAFLAVSVLARPIAGIDVVASFRATMARQQAYLTYDRSYAYWLFGNVVALLITAGIVNAALLVAQTRRTWGARRPGFETVVWATVLLATALGVFKGETDHNWLFFVPLVVVAAAPAATRIQAETGTGLAQAVGTEVLFYTGW